MVEVFHNPDVVLIKFLQAIVDKVLGVSLSLPPPRCLGYSIRSKSVIAPTSLLRVQY